MNQAERQHGHLLDARACLEMPLHGIRLIEASAGTGKTHTITNLYLRYLLAGLQPAQILVVTFTNAATEELRGRIRLRLHSLLRLIESGEAPDSVPDEYFRLLLQHIAERPDAETLLASLKLAARTMDEAAVHTIHGFCQRALTDHAFHSGQGFNITLSNNDDLLWAAALKDWWRRRSYELGAQEGELFVSALGKFSVFLKQQQKLRQTWNVCVLPPEKKPLTEYYQDWLGLHGSMQSLAQQWQQRAEDLKAILLDSKALGRVKGKYRKDNLLSLFPVWDRFFSGDRLLHFPPGLEMLGAGFLQQNVKPTAAADPALQDPFFLACGEVLEAVAAIRSAFRFQALREATEEAQAQVEEAKNSARSMSFNDMLSRLHGGLLSSQGEVLAESLRKEFPVALIDEFQDTDAMQYDIFRRIYAHQATGEDAAPEETPASLLMIGDPKQAIYSFRGGDIFTYMQARLDAGDNRYTLDTNWRSSPALIRAVNGLLAYDRSPFIYEAIEFQAVKAATDREAAVLIENGSPAVALSLWQLPLDENDKPCSKKKAERLVSEAVASEILSLLTNAQSGRQMLDGKPLQAGDIAVLVRTMKQGSLVRDALSALGINAVTVGRDKVFATGEARGLLSLLQALVNPSDRRLLRRALSSELLDHSWQQMLVLSETEENWLAWCQQLQSLSVLWQQKGFMVMFQTMLHRLDIGAKLAAGRNAERRLTNLLHLAELLQQSARTHPGHNALLGWYQQQILDADSEAELRLESDEALVKIVTIHASKGLEYPVVFVPFLWSCKPVKAQAGEILSYHDDSGRYCLDLGTPDRTHQLALAEKERLAEDLRLLYVALTRASARLYLVWGDSQWASADKSALAKLLPLDAGEGRTSSRLPALLGMGEGIIEQCQLPCSSSALQESRDLLRQEEAATSLEPAVFTGRIATDWRIASFSALTREVHQAPHRGSARASGTDEILNFPAGSHVGLFLHSLLEELDFQGDVEAQTRVLFQRHASRYGLDRQDWLRVVTAWLENIVQTPLNTDSGLSLSQLGKEKRLNEMAFDFPVAGLDIQELNSLLLHHAGPDRAGLQPIEVASFRGMMTGIIDLVFEHRGRYYLADYKSNFLGAAITDYARDNLQQVIVDRRYDLQYQLYSVALHRYLRHRLPGYHYDTHFGGVYYLFLRGMRPEHGPVYGVFGERPEEMLIRDLDLLFSRSSSGQALRAEGLQS